MLDFTQETEDAVNFEWYMGGVRGLNSLHEYKTTPTIEKKKKQSCYNSKQEVITELRNVNT